MMRPSVLVALLWAGLFVAPIAAQAAGADDEPDPDAEEAFFLGNGLLAEGDPTGALQAYEEALSLDAAFYRVHLYQGRAFLALNNTALAREAAARFGMAGKSSEEQDEMNELLGQIDAAEQAADEAPPPPPPEEKESVSVQSTATISTEPTGGDIALGVAAGVAIGGWAMAGISGGVGAARRATAFDQSQPLPDRAIAQEEGEALVPVSIAAAVIGGIATAATVALGISKATEAKKVSVGLGPTLGPGLTLTFTPAPRRSEAR